MNRGGDNKTIAIGLLPMLTQELEKAKAAKDHKTSAKLRKQVWVVTDYSHGVEPDIPKDELREILKDLPLTMPGETPVSAPPLPPIKSSTNTINRLNKLKKRLERIQILKASQEQGEKLEKNQTDMINNEDQTLADLAELEELIAAASS